MESLTKLIEKIETSYGGMLSAETLETNIKELNDAIVATEDAHNKAKRQVITFPLFIIILASITVVSLKIIGVYNYDIGKVLVGAIIGVGLHQAFILYRVQRMFVTSLAGLIEQQQIRLGLMQSSLKLLSKIKSFAKTNNEEDPST